MKDPESQIAADIETLPPTGWKRRLSSKWSFHAEFVRNTQSSYSEETRLLLQSRLKAAAFFLLAAHIAFSLRSLILQAETPLGFGFTLALLAILAVIAGLLYRLPTLSMLKLRAVEVSIGGVLTLFLASTSYLDLRATAGYFEMVLAADETQTFEAVLRSMAVAPLLPFIWLLMLYGMLIPNRWQRAALICLPVVLTPIAIKVALSMQFPELKGLASADRISLSLFLLLLGYASAVYGTYVINSLRHQAFEARRLGQYQLVEKLGAGGMGEVWKGRHRMLARPAAIKLIRSDRLGTEDQQESLLTLKRFEREAQATAGLSSPHSVTLYDFGITDDETFYYVMELLDGVDLETLVERFGPAPSERAIHLLVQACESLADAHQSGLIHRDVKPANLFTCRLGRVCDFVKVLDFGLVKTREMQGDDSAQLTRVGAITGTPAFIAPEQALGRALDHRADLYGLGCVAYWLVTGRPVFEGESAVSVLADHIKTDPVPPSQLCELPVGADFEKIILNCLDKSPDNRPADAEELAESLRQCRDAGGWGRAEAAAWWELHLGAKDQSPNAARSS